MTVERQLSHRVAVIAYIVKDHKFLLLKRSTKPFIWAPPGGHLYRDENPEKGLRREIKEETGLDIEIVAPVNTWFGEWNGSALLSIDYLVKITGGELRLSNEHSAYAWISVEQLREGDPVPLDPRLGFTIEDFENTDRFIRALTAGGYLK